VRALQVIVTCFLCLMVVVLACLYVWKFFYV
jgi:hypothetical protein